MTTLFITKKIIYPLSPSWKPWITSSFRI